MLIDYKKGEKYFANNLTDYNISNNLNNWMWITGNGASSQEYFKTYGLTPEKLALARPDAIVMHPGPMNRGVEIDSAVADGGQAVILPQVTFGIAVRMAVMSIVAGN